MAVTALNKDVSHRFPLFLPGSRKFLFYAFGTSGTGNIYLGSLDSSATKLLTGSDSAGGYLASGWLLFIRGSTLFSQRLDSASGELTGDPVVVADPVAFDATFAGGFSASATGLIAYRRGGFGQTQLTWFDRSGKTLGTMGAPDTNSLNGPRLSPDGRRAAVFRTVQNNTDIWIMDETRTTRFTFDPGLDRYPVWSPDGSRIVFDSNRKGQRNLYVKPANGGGEEEPLLESPNGSGATDWSRDGHFILYQVPTSQTGVDIWALPLQGDRKPFVFLGTNFDERSGRFSPDGRWVAYESNASSRYEVYVRPFGGSSSGGAAGGQWQISSSGGLYPRWRADGKELYFVSRDGKLMAAPITSSNAGFEAGAPVVLFQTRMPESSNPTIEPQYDISSDGRFLINTVIEEANTPITLLQNWNPGEKK